MHSYCEELMEVVQTFADPPPRALGVVHKGVWLLASKRPVSQVDLKTNQFLALSS